MDQATKDGKNMAAVLRTLTSGLSTYVIVYDALEAKFKPFQDADFREEFYEHNN